MQRIKKWTEELTRNSLKIVFSIVFLIGLWIKPVYKFDDSPCFEKINLVDIMMFGLIILIFAALFYLRDIIQDKIRLRHIFLLFWGIALLYIYLVPLKPFSDMQQIYETAKNFASFQWEQIGKGEYWMEFPGNIRVGIFWGILLIPFPKTLLTMKLLNAVFVWFICYLTAMTCKELGMQYYKLILIGQVCYLPLLLYINHTYYDMPLVFLGILAIYVYMKNHEIVKPAVILCVASYLRSTGLIFLIAIGLDYIYRNYKCDKEKKKNIQNILKVVGIIVLVYWIGKGTGGLVKDYFVPKEYSSYPMWNFYYIGMNEEEFGFMDNDFDKNRAPEDIMDRVQEYGAERLIKIYLKKIEWTWMQGTYQAQRYGLGPDVEHVEEKFEYETLLSVHLLNDGQKLRQAINSFMRAQYMLFFFLMLLAMWGKKDITEYRTIYFILFGTMMILIFWEMKSRYIVHCLPLISILACQGIEYFEKIEKKIRNKCNIFVREK